MELIVMRSSFTRHWQQLIRSVLIAMGGLWLPIEAYEGLANTDANLSFNWFLGLSVFLGIAFYFIDGYFIGGFLQHKVKINPHGFDTDIYIEFGDLFSRSGWKAVAVNDFFDSQVDEDIVSSKSLHGYTINHYWPDNKDDWQKQINASIKGSSKPNENRLKGNKKRYPIGTTASVTNGNHKFLFFALGETDISNNVTSANTQSLIKALKGMLKKARAVCSYEPLFIPLVGSGLSRVGIKTSILVDLLLVAIIEETRDSKITSNITIVLPKHMKGKINLKNYINNWS